MWDSTVQHSQLHDKRYSSLPLSPNDYKTDNKIDEKNEEIQSLRERLEEVYRELNEYRLRNSELNNEIKKIKENNTIENNSNENEET